MRSFPRPVLWAAAVAALVLSTPAPALAAEGSGGPGTSSFTISDPRITESSGLAASRRHPGVYWTHNDSDDGPYLYAVDSASGRTLARITMTGVGRPRDIEAVSVGPDGQIYVGDIGDNVDSWDHVWIYRLPEPAELTDATVKAVQYTVRYEGGPRNAEALMVHPVTGRVYIASKSEDAGHLYEGPAKLSATGSNVFRRVADVPWVTDGAFSPDGGQLVLRGYFFAETYAWRAGRPAGKAERVAAPFQPQAESVSYSPDGSTLMFGSEGAGSRVVAVPVPKADGQRGADGAGRPAGSGGGEPGGAAAAGTGGGNFTVGAVVLAAATALVLGLKRLLRRGD
ncbi:WD40 repeat domain-containing protein [Streptomyces sp. NPDC089919]|uniref:WD40 repeat domain-containing protein n=1 Tax=Streptomyces sp. NPDC089919 TaxID=3155188 RepID=UPI0034218BE4